MTMREIIKALVDAYNSQGPSVCDAWEMNAYDEADRLDAELAALKAEKATAAEAFRSCEYVDETEGNVALEMSESGWRSLRRYFGRE